MATLAISPELASPIQAGLGWPESLAAKYQPRTIAEFAGLEDVKRKITGFIAKPYPSSWLFTGDSGTGKTTMALAIAEAIQAEVIHVPSRRCDLAEVDRIAQRCHYYPISGRKFHLILVDECDAMTHAAQLAWLSKLDATGAPPNTVTIFTSNSTELEKRFLSRCRVLKFSNYGMAADTVTLLERVWQAELRERGISHAKAPNFARIVKDSCNNVRDALMNLELELMGL